MTQLKSEFFKVEKILEVPPLKDEVTICHRLHRKAIWWNDFGSTLDGSIRTQRTVEPGQSNFQFESLKAMAQNCQVDSMTRNLEMCGNLGVSLGDCVKMLAEGLGLVLPHLISDWLSNHWLDKGAENQDKRMIVAVIIYFILVLLQIQVTLPPYMISKYTTEDTTPTQYVAKLTDLVLLIRSGFYGLTRSHLSAGTSDDQPRTIEFWTLQ